MAKTYLVHVINDHGWLVGCTDVQGVFLGSVDAPLNYAATGIIGCLVTGRKNADALKRELRSAFDASRERPPTYAVAPVLAKTSHVSNFGFRAHAAQAHADNEGFLHYREYSEYLPEHQMTEAERFIHRS